MAIHDDDTPAVVIQPKKPTNTDRMVELSGSNTVDYDPAAGDQPSLTDGILPTVANRVMVEDGQGHLSRKHQTGVIARLARTLHIKIPGVVGEVFYGNRGTRVQIMQYDPSRKLPYGIRKVSPVPGEGENFWRQTVADDDLLCEYEIARANGYSDTQANFHLAVKKGLLDPTVYPTPPELPGA